ncbi:MAG: DMT family transporter [Actinomycetia bacterium]|nr:DMT family transporter [Actinomycetes bacterium]
MTLIDREGARRHPVGGPSSPRRRGIGIEFAGLTALISGFSVFVNGYGVRQFDDATTYTTAKNLIAASLIGATLMAWRSRSGPRRPHPPPVAFMPLHRRWLAFAAVAVIGGSVPFVLFFEGLSRASSTDAAFIHKTLVAWVAVLAVIVLRERLTVLHYVAIGLILWGQAVTMGGVGFPEFGRGELLILAATLCWSVEVVLARYVLARGVDELSLGAARMLGGVGLLLAWAVLRGKWGDLASLTAGQWRWAALTGVFLTGFVITWHFALARAQAVDVTAVLVIGAVVTSLLNAGLRDFALRPVGLVLLTMGALLGGAAASRPRPRLRTT